MTTDDLAALRRDMDALNRRLADLESAPAVEPEPPKLTGDQYMVLEREYYEGLPVRTSLAQVNAAARLRYLEAEVERLREGQKTQPGDWSDKVIEMSACLTSDNNYVPGIAPWSLAKNMAREIARRRGLNVPQ